MEHLVESSKQHEHGAGGPGGTHAVARGASSIHPVLQLQQQAGNQAVQELLRSGVIQAKLAISNPDDPDEREADHVAHTIMRAPAGFPASTPCACSHDGEMCEECQQKQTTIHRRASAPTAPSHVPRVVSDVLHSPGHPLDSASRAFFEPRFGHDFSDVRIHTGPEAAASARSINALAYTAGSNLVFAAGEYAPESTPGRTLLAHELTHVVQQNGTSPSRSELIQRACGPAGIKSVTGCSPSSEANFQLQASNIFLFQFQTGCDSFQSGEEVRVRIIALALAGAASLMDMRIRLDGFASEEGDKKFNDDLSCARAQKVASILTAAEVKPNELQLFYHGASLGDRPAHRSVLISGAPIERRSKPVRIPVPDPHDIDIWPHWKPKPIPDPGIDMWPHFTPGESVLHRIKRHLRDLKDLIKHGIDTVGDVLDELNKFREEVEDRLMVLLFALAAGLLIGEGAEVAGEIKALKEILAELDELEDALRPKPEAPHPAPTDAGVPPRPAGVDEPEQPRDKNEDVGPCGGNQEPVGDWRGFHHYSKFPLTGTIRKGQDWTDYLTNSQSEARAATGVPDYLCYRASLKAEDESPYLPAHWDERPFSSIVFGIVINVRHFQAIGDVPENAYVVDVLRARR